MVALLAGFSGMGCEDYDASPVEAMLRETGGSRQRLLSGETITLEGTVEASHPSSFHFDPEGEFDDVDGMLVVVDRPDLVPEEDARVKVVGRLERAVRNPFVDIYDIEYESVEDGFAQHPMFAADKVIRLSE